MKNSRSTAGVGLILLGAGICSQSCAATCTLDSALIALAGGFCVQMVEPVPPGERLERHFISCTQIRLLLLRPRQIRQRRFVHLNRLFYVRFGGKLGRRQAPSVRFNSPAGFQTAHLACGLFISSKHHSARQSKKKFYNSS